MRAAVDVGGTFTDVLVYDEKSRTLWSAKVPSDPWRPADPFLRGLQRALDSAGVGIDQVEQIAHGTTVVTNALLEGKVAKVGLLVTEGFRDLLEIGRQQRPYLYDLVQGRPPPLVPRNFVREVRERVDASGNIVIPLDEEQAVSQIRALVESGIDSLAVVLLFSFRNPEHEARLESLARRIAPDRPIFLSSKVLPEFREYERASTTVIAAAVAPKVTSYLDDIQRQLRSKGWERDGLVIMHSSGGSLPPEEAVVRPHTLVESGPAAGMIAASQVARILGLRRAIGFDMGGTTAKAGLLLDGQPRFATEYEVGGEVHHGGRVRGSGYPVRFPMIDVAECGAGAGSIAWIDAGGHLKVGPKSAGADPGPACYGKGGDNPTVTDAHLILGRLDPNLFLGGEMPLQLELAERAIRQRVAEPLGLSVEQAAQGILSIANATMIRILRVVSVARGHDPRDFTLIAYGGAGPLHATDLAEEMGIQMVIVPVLPGLFSALGLLYADMSADFVATIMRPLVTEALGVINETCNDLMAAAETWFARVDAEPSDRTVMLSADLRYQRQNYELNVGLPRHPLSQADVASIIQRFHEVHSATYGHSSPGETIQVVNLRVRAVRQMAKPEPQPLAPAREPAGAAPRRRGSLWFGGQLLECDEVSRADLQPGDEIEGPAVVREDGSTTVVNPGWRLTVDMSGNLLLQWHAARGKVRSHS